MRGVEDKLCAVAVFKSCRAFNGVASLAQRFNDGAREERKAARPAAIAHPFRQRPALGLSARPVARARLRFQEFPALFYPQRPLRAEDFQAMLRTTRLDYRE